MSISWLFWTIRSAARRQCGARAGVPGWLVLGLLLACPARPGGSAQFSLVAEWGEYGTKPGQFNCPFGIAIDSRGAVYVSDLNNHRVQKF